MAIASEPLGRAPINRQRDSEGGTGMLASVNPGFRRGDDRRGSNLRITISMKSVDVHLITIEGIDQNEWHFLSMLIPPTTI
jgi:hypothetical protein